MRCRSTGMATALDVLGDDVLTGRASTARALAARIMYCAARGPAPQDTYSLDEVGRGRGLPGRLRAHQLHGVADDVLGARARSRTISCNASTSPAVEHRASRPRRPRCPSVQLDDSQLLLVGRVVDARA